MSETAVAEAVVEEPVTDPRQEKRTKDKVRTKKQPPYAVIVYNDEDHTFPYVINLLRKVCGHVEVKAIELTRRIDRTGKAVVWTGSLEVAELKRDQIRGFGPDFYAANIVKFPMGVDIEPMPMDS